MKSISCLYLPTFRSQASIFSEKSTVFTFSYRKAEVSKFDLSVKKVTSGLSFIQTMMGRSPRCYIPSFVEIGPPVVLGEDFLRFLPYMGMAAILVM